MKKASLTEVLRQRARELGFAQVGVAPAVMPTGYHKLLEWLSAGHAGDMDWIERRREAYRHPDGVMPGTRSVVMLAMNYHDGTPPTSGPRIARYAMGYADYHDVLKPRLGELAAIIREQHPGARTRSVIDTAPLLERDFGRLAGLGWFGKNTMLISRSIGSWFFLGAILTDVELDYDDPEDDDYCGTCTACLDACPTQAFPEPGVLDARRCISYLTIELRGQPIPLEFRRDIGEWLFGCDVCQDVCPWNRFAPPETLPEFQAPAEMHRLDLQQLLQMTEDDIGRRFDGSPLLRAGRVGLVQNAMIVAANLKRRDLLTELAMLTQDKEPVLQDVAAWAMETFRPEED
jgi:epoxyqueuosine reductase